ncbi:MAG TPA: SET domain-containing protein-lysine N-methyltransferase [Candidatus Angelobacter sp.]|jgi:SET domain-containing protein|nr:SET domain-containing protein-lysine N-methyltransferase [Candidatus Angelobacter sp.]
MLIVKKSRIQGEGLYTDRAIRARKKIGEYTGERISVAEANRRSKGQKRIAIIELSDKEAIDGSVNGGPFQYLNHSCDPNVFTRIAYGRAEFYTLRNIRAGEELTCDYVESQHEGTLPCRCGSVKCRKFI